MRAEELRQLAADELPERLDELQRELFNLRFQRATGQLTDTTRLRQLRRDIARVRTIMREMQIEAEGE
jgi:large subunit ribosomal protein L29